MGENTTNGYFYKPAYGAYGSAEMTLFHDKLDIADAAIKANLDGLATKQPLDTGLTSIAALTTAANKMIYTTALDTYAVTSLTAFARTILDDADAATVRTTIGAAASSANSDITSLTGLTTPLGAAYGGTGVANNAASTITITGNFTLGLTISANTTLTLPTSGTLINSAVTTLSSLVSIGTITTGTWSATTIAIAKGGTGVTTGAMTGLTSILNPALYVGRDVDNKIDWATDDQLKIKIAGTEHAIVSITDGTGDNDKLVTQGYVDDNIGAGDVTKVGTPVNNQIGIWTGDGTLEGDANLTYDGTTVVLGTGQINFPDAQNASADANTLDDYEEGTFTPTITFGGNSVDMVYDVQLATYTKIGRMVTICGYVGLSNKGTSTGNASINALPFACISGSGAFAPASFAFANITFANILQGYVATGQSYITLQEVTESGTMSTLTDADFANNSYLMFNATYFTS